MYELMAEDTFDAAHQLRGYQGKCENLHGHTFKVQAFFLGQDLPGSGMLIDFKKIKEELALILSGFDHKNLNDLPEFKNTNPTSENIAREIYHSIKIPLPSVSKVTVFESPSSSATYFERS